MTILTDDKQRRTTWRVYLDIKLILRRQYVTSQSDNPESLVLVKELAMYSDSVP